MAKHIYDLIVFVPVLTEILLMQVLFDVFFFKKDPHLNAVVLFMDFLFSISVLFPSYFYISPRLKAGFSDLRMRRSALLATLATTYQWWGGAGGEVGIYVDPMAIKMNE